jgi:hypothetical protein
MNIHCTCHSVVLLSCVLSALLKVDLIIYNGLESMQGSECNIEKEEPYDAMDHI